MKIDDEVNHLSPDSRKPVFGASEKARLKPVSSATENRQISEILLEASLDMIPSSKRKIKALIRLRGCPGWSVPLLLANLGRQVFSH